MLVSAVVRDTDERRSVNVGSGMKGCITCRPAGRSRRLLRSATGSISENRQYPARQAVLPVLFLTLHRPRDVTNYGHGPSFTTRPPQERTFFLLMSQPGFDRILEIGRASCRESA